MLWKNYVKYFNKQSHVICLFVCFLRNLNYTLSLYFPVVFFFFFAYKFLSFDLSLWFYFIVLASKSQTNLVAGLFSP